MGAFDTAGFLALTGTFPNLYLDTTMTLTPAATPYVGIDPQTISTALILEHQDRIMLGSDFPLIPYAYDEERRFVAERALPESVARKILYENAVRFLGLDVR
jgi:uncharacterized protein